MAMQKGLDSIDQNERSLNVKIMGLSEDKLDIRNGPILVSDIEKVNYWYEQ